jgi:hypothetical protein
MPKISGNRHAARQYSLVGEAFPGGPSGNCGMIRVFMGIGLMRLYSLQKHLPPVPFPAAEICNDRRWVVATR